MKENIPDVYSAYYFKDHEKYDQIKVPIKDTLISSTIKFKVRNYTAEENILRNEVLKIMNIIVVNYDSTRSANLYNEFLNKYPGNRYLDQLKAYIKYENEFRKINNKN